jgi:hypothetical protein
MYYLIIKVIYLNIYNQIYGFKWMYKEDYEQYIKDKNNNIDE